MRERKVKCYKGWVIAEGIENGLNVFQIYDKEEWELGQGYRSSEWNTDTLPEAIDFIDNY